MWRKLMICAMAAFWICQVGNVCAQPVIGSASGSFTHGATVGINGSSFGSKNPVQPKVWDPCNHNYQLSSRYSEVLPFHSAAGYNIAYRNAPFSSPSGSVIRAPHNYATQVIAGAHYPAVDGTYGWDKGNNVSLTAGNWGGSTSFVLMYFYRIDPRFTGENNASEGPNLKEFVANESTTSSYTGSYHYIDYCNDQVPMYSYPNGGWLKDTSTSPSCSGRTEPRIPNPMRTDVGADGDGWQHFEWQVKFGQGGFAKTYVDNALVFNSSSGFQNSFVVGSATIGGFSRVPTLDPTKAWRYFSDIYMDSTFSRVILANNANYELATKKEPQIPTAWSNDSITFTVNLGKLPLGSTPYLFVFDSNNNHNPVGYQVQLPESSAPAPPAGLRIVP